MKITVLLHVPVDPRGLTETLASISAAREGLPSEVKVEGLIVAPKACEKTRAILATWKLPHRSVFYGNDEDPNSVVTKALEKQSSDYIARVVLGSLLSPRWVLQCLEATAQERHPEKIILRPQLHCILGEANKLFTATGQESPSFDISQMLWVNPWVNTFFMAKKTFLALPQADNRAGFSDPDWHWNCETIRHGFINKIVAGSCLYWRETDSYIQSFIQQKAEARAVYPSRLFDQRPPDRKAAPKRASSKFSRTAIQNLFAKDRKQISSYDLARLPAVSRQAGEIFFDLQKELGCDVDFLFIMHVLRRGGSELAALHHVRALQKLRPGCKIAILTTELADSDWALQFPENVKIIDFGRLTCQYLTRPEQVMLLLRVLLQTKPKVIHNMLSSHAWDLCRDFADAIRAFTKITASLYCIDFDRHENPKSYAYSHLPQCARQISALFSDNQVFSDHLREVIDFKRTTVLLLPASIRADNPRVTRVKRADTARLQVLWAGRIAFQKNVELLLHLAKVLPQYDFHLYGEFSLKPEFQFYEQLLEIPNLTFHGGFDGIESIPVKKYDVFLYTARWDGTPNILLEVAQKGLPIIAPEVGGIPALIRPETGYLASSVADYVSRLASIQKNPRLAAQKVRRLQRLIRHKHSHDSFEKKIKTVFNEVGI